MILQGLVSNTNWPSCNHQPLVRFPWEGKTSPLIWWPSWLCRSLAACCPALISFLLWLELLLWPPRNHWLDSVKVLTLSRASIAGGVTFTFLFHFEFTFVYAIRKESNSTLLQVDIQFSHTNLLRGLSPFSHFASLKESRPIWTCKFYCKALWLGALGVFKVTQPCFLFWSAFIHKLL